MRAPKDCRPAGRGTRDGRFDRAEAEAGAAALAALLGLALLAAAASAADFQRTFTFQAQEITVTNFIGAVRVEPSSGSEVRLVVDVRGKDADRSGSSSRSSREPVRSSPSLPLKESHRYVYPEMRAAAPPSAWTKIARTATGSASSSRQVSDRIEVRGRPWRDALELWATSSCRCRPPGMRPCSWGSGALRRTTCIGSPVRVRSGPVRAEGIRGKLDIDTGSGSVDVLRVQGDLRVDTGSGEVNVGDVRDAKRIVVETGSGSVEVMTSPADDLSIDTGSGGVDLNASSGSRRGHRQRRSWVGRGAESVKVDTAAAACASSWCAWAGELDVETGSGGIRMRVPATSRPASRGHRAATSTPTWRRRASKMAVDGPASRSAAGRHREPLHRQRLGAGMQGSGSSAPREPRRQPTAPRIDAGLRFSHPPKRRLTPPAPALRGRRPIMARLRTRGSMSVRRLSITSPAPAPSTSRIWSGWCASRVSALRASTAAEVQRSPRRWRLHVMARLEHVGAAEVSARTGGAVYCRARRAAARAVV